MTNGDIIRDLHRCANKDVSFCKECKHRNYSNECCIQLMKDAIDLISQQHAEIKDERAKGEMYAEVIARQDKELDDLREIVFMDRTEAIKNLKFEAIKEFAKRLKKKAAPYEVTTAYADEEEVEAVEVEVIDNLVEEMTKEEENDID